MSQPARDSLVWRSIKRLRLSKTVKREPEEADRLWDKLRDQLVLFDITPESFRKWAGISDRTYYHWREQQKFPRLLEIILEYGVLERLHAERKHGVARPGIRDH